MNSVIKPLFFTIIIGTKITQARLKSDKDYCISSFDFKFKRGHVPTNYEYVLDYCTEHAGNTCCEIP